MAASISLAKQNPPSKEAPEAFSSWQAWADNYFKRNRAGNEYRVGTSGTRGSEGSLCDCCGAMWLTDRGKVKYYEHHVWNTVYRPDLWGGGRGIFLIENVNSDKALDVLAGMGINALDHETFTIPDGETQHTLVWREGV